MKEIRSRAKISVVLDNGEWGILTQHPSSNGESYGSSAFTPYSTEKDAQQALAFGRSVLRDGHSDLFSKRKVIKLEVERKKL